MIIKHDVETTVRDFSSIIATGAERGTETEDSTINIQSIIESEGAGYYRVTVQGYHKTDSGKDCHGCTCG